MNPVKSKKYDFDITVTDNTYAGELALPYVTAAVTGAETITNNRCRLIEGVVHKAVISNLGLTDVIQAADCAGTDGANTSLTEQIVTLNDLMVKETICRKTIFPTFIAAQGRMRRDGQIPPAFAEFLLSSVAAKAGESLETLMWAGVATTFPFGLLSNDGVNRRGRYQRFRDAGLRTGTQLPPPLPPAISSARWTRSSQVSPLPPESC